MAHLSRVGQSSLSLERACAFFPGKACCPFPHSRQAPRASGRGWAATAGAGGTRLPPGGAGGSDCETPRDPEAASRPSPIAARRQAGAPPPVGSEARGLRRVSHGLRFTSAKARVHPLAFPTSLFRSESASSEILSLLNLVRSGRWPLLFI